MTAGAELPASGAPLEASECASPLVVVGALFFGLCCLFGFAMSYRGMKPSCVAPYDERAHFAVNAALGPFASTSEDASLSLAPGNAIIAVAAIAAVLLALRFRHNLVLRVLGYAAVFVWLSIGCSAVVARIT